MKMFIFYVIGGVISVGIALLTGNFLLANGSSEFGACMVSWGIGYAGYAVCDYLRWKWFKT